MKLLDSACPARNSGFRRAERWYRRSSCKIAVLSVHRGNSEQKTERQNVASRSIHKELPSTDEAQQILVYTVFQRRTHSVRSSRDDYELGALDDLGRQERRSADRHDLVVVAVKDQGGNVKPLEVFRQIRFGERLDAIVDSYMARQHP